MLMKDIQDGIKVSIQDGVTEDPNIPDVEELTDVQHKSFGGVIYIVTEISNPEIKSGVKGETSSAITATISSSVAGVVT